MIDYKGYILIGSICALLALVLFFFTAHQYSHKDFLHRVLDFVRVILSLSAGAFFIAFLYFHFQGGFMRFLAILLGIVLMFLIMTAGFYLNRLRKNYFMNQGTVKINTVISGFEKYYGRPTKTYAVFHYQVDGKQYTQAFDNFDYKLQQGDSIQIFCAKEKPEFFTLDKIISGEQKEK